MEKTPISKIRELSSVELKEQWITEDLGKKDKPKTFFGRVFSKGPPKLEKVAEELTRTVKQLKDGGIWKNFRDDYKAQKELAQLSGKLYAFEIDHMDNERLLHIFDNTIEAVTSVLSDVAEYEAKASEEQARPLQ